MVFGSGRLCRLGRVHGGLAAGMAGTPSTEEGVIYDWAPPPQRCDQCSGKKGHSSRPHRYYP